jgi:chromosome segregation ATPase
MPITRVNQLPDTMFVRQIDSKALSCNTKKAASKGKKSKRATVQQKVEEVVVVQDIKNDPRVHAQLSQKCEHLSRENSRLQDNIKSLTITNSRLTKEHLDKVNELKLELNKQQTKGPQRDDGKLHAKLAELRDNHSNVKQQLSAKHEFCKELHERVNKLSSELEETRSELHHVHSRHKKEKQDLQSKLANTDKMRDAVEHAMEMHKVCADILKSRCLNKIAGEVENGMEILRASLND